MAEIKIVTFLLLIALASPAVNQYLTGKIQKKHLVDKTELLLKDVFDCSGVIDRKHQTIISVFTQTYHSL